MPGYNERQLHLREFMPRFEVMCAKVTWISLHPSSGSAPGKAMIRTIQDKVDGLRSAVRQVIDRVRGPARGPDRGGVEQVGCG